MTPTKESELYKELQVFTGISNLFRKNRLMERIGRRLENWVY